MPHKEAYLCFLWGQKNSSCAPWGRTSLISADWNFKKDVPTSSLTFLSESFTFSHISFNLSHFLSFSHPSIFLILFSLSGFLEHISRFFGCQHPKNILRFEEKQDLDKKNLFRVSPTPENKTETSRPVFFNRARSGTSPQKKRALGWKSSFCKKLWIYYSIDNVRLVFVNLRMSFYQICAL